MPVCSRYTYVLAGALLLGALGTTQAQDANREIVETRTDVGGIVDRVAKSTGQFKDEFNDAVSHSMMNGTRLEANAKHRADDLHNTAKKLADVFHDKKDKNNPAVRQQADRTIATASELNRVMIDHRFTDKLQRDWEMLRSDLNALARVYELSPIDGGVNR